MMSTLLWRLTGGILPLPLAASLAAVQPALADDATVNRLLASQCAQCHGTNGHAVGDFEDLAGEEAKDLYEDLSDMKREDRPENIMDHQALGYTDDQIRRIAAFYATLPEEDGHGDSGRLDASGSRSAWEDRKEREDEDERDERERDRERDEDD